MGRKSRARSCRMSCTASGERRGRATSPRCRQADAMGLDLWHGDLPNVAIELPPFSELLPMLPAEYGPLILAEQERTAKALHAVGEPFSPEGRIRFVALWRAWNDGLDAVFADDPRWGEAGKALYEMLDNALDWLEGKGKGPCPFRNW